MSAPLYQPGVPGPSVGLLKFPVPGTTTFVGGTATLIAADIVCTAAHVVYDPKTDMLGAGGFFVPGFATPAQLAPIPVAAVYVPPEVHPKLPTDLSKAQIPDRFDFAFVKLASPVPNVKPRQVSYTAVAPALAGQPMTLYGYPGGKQLQSAQTTIKKGMLEIELPDLDNPGCPIPLVTGGLDSGASGGPVLIDQEQTLIGIITDLVFDAGNQILLFTAHAQAHYEKAVASFQA